jgi:hypothetical protein
MIEGNYLDLTSSQPEILVRIATGGHDLTVPIWSGAIQKSCHTLPSSSTVRKLIDVHCVKFD